MKENNIPAFPSEFGSEGGHPVPGMTLLDYFAGQVITGLVTQANFNRAKFDMLATDAYNIAGYMLEERKKHV